MSQLGGLLLIILARMIRPVVWLLIVLESFFLIDRMLG